jgi:hypothetical protein
MPETFTAKEVEQVASYQQRGQYVLQADWSADEDHYVYFCSRRGHWERLFYDAVRGSKTEGRWYVQGFDLSRPEDCPAPDGHLVYDPTMNLAERAFVVVNSRIEAEDQRRYEEEQTLDAFFS